MDLRLGSDTPEEGADRSLRLRLALEAAADEALRRRALVRWGVVALALCAALAIAALLFFAAVL